jgi:hypothetical protein
MLTFIIGLFIGSTAGAITTAIVAARKISDLNYRIHRVARLNHGKNI